MGKFERREAEILEKAVAYILNSREEKVSHMCARVVTNHIRRDFGEIVNAEFIGRSYNEPGDIKLVLRNGRVAYVELKYVIGGKGTRANIGQDALTEFKLFKGEGVLSWSAFRKKEDFDKKVLELLNQYKHYDPAKLRAYKGGEKERKARYLREILKPGPGEAVENVVERVLKSSNDKVKEAALIVKQILDLAREDKLKYIEYLIGLEQDPEAIRKFTILLLLGVHKKNSIKQSFYKFGSFIKSLKEGQFNYVTYYVRKGNCKVCKEDLTSLINKLLVALDFRVLCERGETNCLIEYKDPGDNRWKPLLRVVFHWKNVFQGIATPCLNIFDAGELERICFSSSSYS
ncbi:MAG: hypothetical protein ACP5IE_02615 [Infirmifilum sp.]